MKIRVRFSKYGLMKYVGHLDTMRYFQKAIRRADIDITYSEGFSPHMIMSFALPLGVGVTSSGEYMDIEINTPISSKEAVERLNEVMVPGLIINSFLQIPDGKVSNAMSLVAAADYRITLSNVKSAADSSESDAPGNHILLLQEELKRFLAQEQILIVKKTKTSEALTDIRPMICSGRAEGSELCFRLSAGSAANLKPELVMEAFQEFTRGKLFISSFAVHREDLLMEGNEPFAFVSLEKAETSVIV